MRILAIDRKAESNSLAFEGQSARNQSRAVSLVYFKSTYCVPGAFRCWD